MTEQWLLVSGDFTPLGGMDRANHALAHGLLRRGHDVQVVAHRVWHDLRAGSLRATIVPRPLGSHFAGAPLLALAAGRAARRLARGRRVTNGGNAAASDVTWIHYLHAAHDPPHASIGGRARAAAARRYYLRRERAAIAAARFVVCNSRKTAGDVARAYGVSSDRLRVVYYGSDAAVFSAVDPEAQGRVRHELGWPVDRRVALFVGALGDRRKGFDRLFNAWQSLAAEATWDVDLAVVGAGAELPAWRARAAAAGLSSIRFLAFRPDVATVMAACDVLVHPARYEAYGLGVHEAISRGLPAIVSARAGIAELYPGELTPLLIQDVEDEHELRTRLRAWHEDPEGWRRACQPFSKSIGARTWDHMAEEFIDAVCP